jgi:hypothetical protein
MGKMSVKGVREWKSINPRRRSFSQKGQYVHTCNVRACFLYLPCFCHLLCMLCLPYFASLDALPSLGLKLLLNVLSLSYRPLFPYQSATGAKKTKDSRGGVRVGNVLMSNSLYHVYIRQKQPRTSDSTDQVLMSNIPIPNRWL